jgi:nitrogen fixation protein NifX
MGEAFEVETAVKVAFATGDMKHVDQHFGAAEGFAVYALDPERATLVEAVQFGKQVMDGGSEGRRRGPAAGGEPTPGGATGPKDDAPEAPVVHRRSHPRSAEPLLNASGHYEDKLGAKIEALDGCIAVYCQAVGGSAINQLRAKGIQAVKVSPGSRIKDLIESLQDELRQGPSAWLARAIEHQRPRSERRFDDMEQEGWVE